MRVTTRTSEKVVGCVSAKLGILERYIIPGWFFLMLVYPSAQALAQATFPANLAIAAAFISLPVSAFVIFNFRICLKVDSEAVLIRNVLRTRRLRMVDIKAVAGTYDGLKFTLVDGRRVLAQAVPKYNISLLTRREDRSDRIAREIVRRAEIARQNLGAKE